MTTNKIRLVYLPFLLLFFNTCGLFGQTKDNQDILWYEDANSIVLNRDSMAKLGEVFLSWKVKQVTWPSEKEVDSNSVTVSEGLKQSCIKWLKKFIKKERLPDNLQEHLIAMEGWGLIREQTEQKRLCDVFITRFKKGNHVIHIQESPYNVVIAVSNESLMKDASVSHKDFIVQIARLILDENFEPGTSEEDFHVTEKTTNEVKITRMTWIAKAALKIDSKGRKCSNGMVSRRIGASGIRAETDGRFVRFEIVKETGSARAYFDPYERRFSPSPSQDSSTKKRKNPEAEAEEEMFKPRSKK